MLSPRRILITLVSLSLLGLALWFSGVENVFSRLANFPFWASGSILLLFLVNLFVVSFRFWRVLLHFGITLPWKVASRASISGHVAGLFMISLFGQVLGRQAVLRNYGIQSIVMSALAAYERVILALVSGVLCAVGAIYLLGDQAIAEFMSRISLGEIFLVATGGGLLSLWLGRSLFEATLTNQALSWRNLGRVAEITGITLTGVILTQFCFVVGIMAVDPAIDFTHLFAAAAIISFAAAMPISVGGWGVREMAAVYVLGKLGVASADALTVSIMVGLCSTLVILMTAPFSLKKAEMLPLKSPPKPIVHSVADIEKIAAWMIGMITAVAVFFQAHITLPGGVANLNLADPFAILALAAVALHSLFARELPGWRISRFNLGLAAITSLLLFAFARGWMLIGVTQWALAGRLIGWLILLGYLAAGYLLVAHAGKHGLRRFADTLIATAAMVIIVQMALRLLVVWGMDTGVYLAYNFEGYAGNRNAFAFQLLASIALLLGYINVYGKHRDSGKKSKRTILIPALLGILLVGVVWTGSRAGMGVLAVLVLAGLSPWSDRKIVFWGIGLAIAYWLGVWLLAQGSGGVQSFFSTDDSNTERWVTLVHGWELWLQSPLLGAGLGVFFAQSTAWLGHPQVIHSTPLWILAELGLLGLTVLAWVFYMLVRQGLVSLKTSPANRSLLLLLAVFAIFGLAHEIFYQRIFWLVLGALLAKPFTYRYAA
ncbi:MAG: lysylphosphatidylglycerol synthase domain-containing protein [Methylococcales bacterium]|nr:lysylphosphatidylglycerol synthase domain-containing protein [Methylococcales bacterium]